MKTTWEFHDSEINKVIEDKNQLRMLISAIVYHDREDPKGLPVCTQNVQLSVSGWNRKGKTQNYPASISAGSILVSSNKYEGEVPIPLKESGDILINLLMADSGDTLIISGTAISIIPIGPEEFLDYYPRD
ncbi:MAG: hypothetical protein H6624_00480 [Bdellovibrionaceae bacterium]|nr:hypothetical protein [Bdellovibrionales bacterium]MCB9082783.1 hypothetical protein [Pseudobdellovibrionaceae bacterium]